MQDPDLAPSEIVLGDVEALLEHLAPQLRELGGARVLIAGGGGFLLSLLVDLLAAANRRVDAAPMHVTVIDNFSSGSPARLAHLVGRDDVSIVKADIARPLDLPGGADYIVHGASIASPPIYRRFPVETIEANVWGTRHLLDHALESRSASFLFISSSEIYGDPAASAIPTPETYVGHVSSIGPRSCYDESKRLGETLALAFVRQHEVPAKIVRPFNVYGPRLSLEDGRIIPDLIRDARAGGPLHLYSDGLATRSFCYVADAIEGIVRALLSSHSGEAFNIGNDEERSIASVAELVSELSSPSPAITYEVHGDPDYLTDNPNRRCPDLSKSEALLGYRPRTTLRDGMARTLSHYAASAWPASATAAG